MVARTLPLLSALALALGMGAADAGDQVDLGRTSDGLFHTSGIEQEQGHNHISITLHAANGDPAPTARVRRLEVAVTYESEERIVVRRFSGTVRDPLGPPSITPDIEGTEPFSEDACFPCPGLLFALPHDFGGVSAVIDAHLFLDAPVPCVDGADGLCDSANGFLNYLPLLNNPTLYGQPWPGADATDAVPERIWLL